MMRYLNFVYRMLRRDARAGELYLLVAALIVAVAALTAVGFFTDRVRQALEREANQLLGADMLLTADHPWKPDLREEAKKRGLRVVETQTFPSMVSIGEGDDLRAQLADIKAVEAGYPLRGALRIADGVAVTDRRADDVPEPGTVWIDERLAATLGAGVGERVAVGQRILRIDAILTFEPDRGLNFFSVAPRLLMNVADVPSTALIQPGSRIRYRLLFSGESQQIKEFKGYVDKSLEPGERIEDTENARPEVRSALDRAQRFLGISALLTVVLAAVAVALAARRYMQRHLDPCAIMRCLGATQGFLLRVYLGQFAILGLVSSLAGCILGYLAHYALYGWLAQFLEVELPPPGLIPALQGAAIGLTLLFGFALPPLMQLKRVSTLRVLRREFSGGRLPPSRLIASYVLGLAGLAGLMFWVADDLRLGAYVVGGFSGALVVFALVARIVVRLASLLRGGMAGRERAGGVGWRYGLASLERRSVASVVQIVALALGFMALLLLTVTRNDLLNAWSRSLPADAPNQFVVNIQPDQLDAVRANFSAHQLAAEFAPMIRGRLVKVNDKPVHADDYEEERAQRLVEREFNLSHAATLPTHNTLAGGRWQADEADGLSVEEGLARTLGLKLGDRMGFDIAGTVVEGRITSLRRVDWGSMRVNFFVMFLRAEMPELPATYISALRAPARAGFDAQLARDFPNLTVVDVSQQIAQVQKVLDQVIRAVEFLFGFTLAAGLLVLFAAVSATRESRAREFALLRAMGAGSALLRQVQRTELFGLGALAGLLAALAAVAVSWALARQVFGFAWTPSPWVPLAGTVAGALMAALAGWWSLRGVLQRPVSETLRQAAAD